MSNLTGSGLDRASKCIASVTYPQEDSSGEGAERGRAVARYLERVTVVGAEVALAEVPAAYVDICAAIDLDKLPTTLAAEVAFAYNGRTGEALELGRGIDRDYGRWLTHHRPACTVSEWLFGTVDVLGVGDAAVFVADHKGYQEVPSARTNLQLGFGALCASKVYGKHLAEVAIYRPLTGARPDAALLDLFDLESIEWTIMGLYQREFAINAGTLEVAPTPGSHCRYCKAAAACPVADRVVSQALTVREPFDWRAPVTRENAADFYLGLKALDEWKQAKLRAVYAIAKEEPLALGNGRYLGEREKQGKESIDDTIGYTVILKHLGEQVANDACPRQFTKAALDRALTAHGVKGKTKVKDAIVEDIRAAGGSKRSTRREVEEYGGE